MQTYGQIPHFNIFESPSPRMIPPKKHSGVLEKFQKVKSLWMTMDEDQLQYGDIKISNV